MWISCVEFNNTDRLQKLVRSFVYFATTDFFANEFKFDYGTLLQKLEISSLRNRRFILNGIFLINLFKGRIYCDSLLNNICLKTQNVRLRDNSLFYSNRGSYFTRCVNSVNNILKKILKLHRIDYLI